MKHLLSDKDKKIFIIVIPLQVRIFKLILNSRSIKYLFLCVKDLSQCGTNNDHRGIGGRSNGSYHMESHICISGSFMLRCYSVSRRLVSFVTSEIFF